MTEPHAPHARRAATWRRYLRFWGPRGEADVDDELRFHIEMRVRDYMAAGLTEDEARAATARRLGDLATDRAECLTITTRRERRMTRAQLIDAFGQDAHFAFRTLGRQKGWTAVAILTLALGIGANTAVFSVVNSLLLHPLPYPHADRVAILFQEPTEGNQTGMNVMVSPRPELVQAWRQNAHLFESIEGFAYTDMTFVPPRGEAAIVHAASILPSLSRFTDQHALIGRSFTDTQRRAGDVALLSEGIWRSRFGSDPAVLGTSVMLDGAAYTVVGVMPAVFSLPAPFQQTTDVWLPLDVHNDKIGMSAMARLRPEVNVGAAQRRAGLTIHGAARREARESRRLPDEARASGADGELPRVAPPAHGRGGARAPHRRRRRAPAARARGDAPARARDSRRVRRGDGPTRQAAIDGKPRPRRRRLSRRPRRWLARPEGVDRAPAVEPLESRHGQDGHDDAARRDRARRCHGAVVRRRGCDPVGAAFDACDAQGGHALDLAFAAAASPARASRGERDRALDDAPRRRVAPRAQRRAAADDGPGLRFERAHGLSVVLPEKSYASPAAKRAFYAELVARARAVHGVEVAMMAEGAPPMRSFLIGALQLEGEAPPKEGTTAFISFNGVQPDYFRQMGIRILQGTTISDTTEKSTQVMVNEGFARKFWHGENAVGRRLRIVYNGKGDWMTIVGVAANAFTSGLTSEATDPMLYMPFHGRYQPSLIVRATPGTNAIATVRSLVPAIDRHLPSPSVTSVEDAMLESISGPRFTTLLACFTVLALVLAAVGLYGVLA